nr:hypothetical protein PJ912_22770 [Pectobacterium colocasium]
MKGVSGGINSVQPRRSHWYGAEPEEMKATTAPLFDVYAPLGDVYLSVTTKDSRCQTQRY